MVVLQAAVRVRHVRVRVAGPEILARREMLRGDGILFSFVAWRGIVSGLRRIRMLDRVYPLRVEISR